MCVSERKRERNCTCQTLFVAFRHPHQGLRIAHGCPDEALPIGVFAYAFEDRAHGRGELVLPGCTFGRRGTEARDGGFCYVGEGMLWS